jgi:hypothetical protein
MAAFTLNGDVVMSLRPILTDEIWRGELPAQILICNLAQPSCFFPSPLERANKTGQPSEDHVSHPSQRPKFPNITLPSPLVGEGKQSHGFFVR